VATRLLVMTQSEDASLYYTTKGDEELIPALVGQHWRVAIYDMTMATTQTPNPWGGMLLKRPVVVTPNEYAHTLIQNALIQLDGMTKEQVVAEVNRFVGMIYDYQNKHLDSIKREENDPRTEIITSER
jgi:hypothetical protein